MNPVQAYTIDPSWAVLTVPNPPSDSVNDDDPDYTWVKDAQGNITRVPNNQVPNTPTPFFSAKDDVRFELFTPSNPTEAHLLLLDNSTTVENSHFNPEYPTRILVHGWNSEGLLTPRFAEAYLVIGKHKVNFIALNWQKGSDTLDYFAARNRVKEVAKHLANFIDFLAEKHKLKFKDLTIVGHSLGAHISGIGKISKNKSFQNMVFNYIFIRQPEKLLPKEKLQKSSVWIRLHLNSNSKMLRVA